MVCGVWLGEGVVSERLWGLVGLEALLGHSRGEGY